MDLLAISGSLRPDSSNTALLRAMRALAPTGLRITLYEGLDGLVRAVDARIQSGSGA